MKPTPKDMFAQAVSFVLTPLLLPTVVVILVLVDVSSSALEILTTAAVVLLTLFAVPFADILYMVRRGKTATLDVPERHARTEAFAVALVSASAAVWIVRAMDFPGRPLIHVILITYILNVMLIMGINLFWKISVHMMAISGSLAILLIVAGLSGESSTVLVSSAVGPAFVLIPLTGWARFQLRAHTVGQIVVGAILGFCCHWLAMLAQVS